METKTINCTDTRSNILIYLRGKNKNSKKLYLSGHLDTVPIGEKPWSFNPFEGKESEGRIYGRGACDMKGGVAALIETMIVLKESNIELEHDIIFVGTAGEEVDCLGAKTVIEHDLIENPGAMIIAEPSSSEVFVGHKGVLWIEITTFGKTAHGSMPDQGLNAISAMMTIIEHLKTSSFSASNDLLGNSTMSINRIQGGIAPNVVPDSCSITIDIRTVSENENEQILQKITNIITQLETQDKSFKATLSVLQNSNPLTNNTNNNFIKLAQQLNYDMTNKKISNLGVNYYTDASIFRKYLDIPIIIYGAGNEKLAHQPDEYIEISELVQSVNYYLEIAKSYDSATV